ncbi:D-inositol-3-phosphate glycosyltransferase [compost metagenome]
MNLAHSIQALVSTKRTRVALIGRISLLSDPGGDTIQIKMTCKYIKKEAPDITVDFFPYSHELLKKIDDYDIFHFFSVTDCCEYTPLMNRLRTSGKLIVLSPIHLDYSEFERYGRGSISSKILALLPPDTQDYAKNIAKSLLGKKKISLEYIIKGQKKSVRNAISNADILLPNSYSELQRVARVYSTSFPAKIVPNGIDEEIFTRLSCENLKDPDQIICVGRIEGRKNQLSLIKAALDLNKKLTIVGKPAKNQPGYYEKCLAISKGSRKIKFLEYVPQQELAKLFQTSKVHALPSWFETTGLVTLEAASQGCNIVVGDRGDVRDYFKDYAFYCNPADIESIAQAILAACNNTSHSQAQFSKQIFSDLTWRKAAEHTLAAYSNQYFI